MGFRIAQLATLMVLWAVALPATRAQLEPNYYWATCPLVETIVTEGLAQALQSDTRIGASLLRMHFHDCFVQGCDASVLLVDTPTFIGEQSAITNAGSLRGFEVVDTIKASVEAACPGVVSCADILTIIASHSVMAAGGAPWVLQLGRRDSLTASLSGATLLPSPMSNVVTLTSKFASVGLDQNDLVTLSGVHTFGLAQCATFLPRLYNFQSSNAPDPTINKDFLKILRANCPHGSPTTTAMHFDQGTPMFFDNSYYNNLEFGRGLLFSDQSLRSEEGPTAALSKAYAADGSFFYGRFIESLTKMSAINPLTGSQGEIRLDCRYRNSDSQQ